MEVMQTNKTSESTLSNMSARGASLSIARPYEPLLPLLIRLALPTVVVMFMVTALSVAETYFVSRLGTEAIAAASLVVPVILLMTMVSNGGIGGGVSAAIARATGAGRVEEAEALAWHAFILAIGIGLLWTAVMELTGPVLYTALGGTGKSLQLAVEYSNILFGAAAATWVLMLMQAALRGVGNVKVPALVVAVGVVLGFVVSPALISGFMGLPRLGVAGAGVAQVITSLVGASVLMLYMRSPGASLKLKRRPLRSKYFRAILGIGALSSLNAVMVNLSLTCITAAAGHFGLAALAGYGIASRLDGLLIPVMFGFGTAALTIVGNSIGAGNIERAQKAAVINAIFVAGLVEMLGLAVATWPSLWLQWFTTDDAVLAAGATYLQIVGPTYGLTAIATELYFAGQGAGRIGWPLAATAIRLMFAAGATVFVVVSQFAFATALLFFACGVVISFLISVWGFRQARWGQEN